MTAAEFDVRFQEQEARFKANHERLMHLALELVKRAQASETVRRVVGEAAREMHEKLSESSSKIIRKVSVDLHLSDEQQQELREMFEENGGNGKHK
jgi:hypothetical protein